MPLEMDTDRVGPECAVVSIRGGMTLGTTLKSIEGSVVQLIGEGVRKLVLDVTECGYSDSAGLGFLVHTYGVISQKGGAMRLCGAGERITNLLAITKTDAILPCDPTRVESLEALGCAGAAGGC